MSDAFDEILAVISASDLDLNKVVLSNLLGLVTGDISTEKAVLEHCLRMNSEDLSRGAFKVDVDKVAHFKARKILSKVRRGAARSEVTKKHCTALRYCAFSLLRSYTSL